MIREHPILFQGAMVRALLDGRKTQTRRIVKPADLARVGASGDVELWTGFMGWQSAEAVLADQSLSTNKQTRCPYGAPGDRLWVRETWANVGTMDPGLTVYRADYPACVPKEYQNVPPAEAITWSPSIHMFRRYSRITLEITDVRVERLQDISEADTQAEGWQRRPEISDDPQVHAEAARDWYMDLWESINGRGSWATNPWVWVVEFKRVQK